MTKLIDGKIHDKESIVRQYDKLVYHCASRLVKGSDFDDLASEGFIGLLHAYEHFDPSKGYKFITYARHCIHGRMLRFKRKNESGAHFAKQVIEIAWSIHKHNLYDMPVEEIASRLNQVDRYVERALEYLKIKHPLYLDKSTNEEESKVLSLHESHGRPDDLTIVEVNDFIAGLPERDKVIVMGLYQELSQREISKIVGVSQNHVSRLIRRIKDKYNSYQSVGD